MKIILPIKVHKELDFDNVNGGIIKFSKQIWENFDDVIPVPITKEDREQRRTRQIIRDAIHKHSPDIAIGNEIDYLHNGFFQEYDIPLISIMHEPRSGDIRMVPLGERLKEMRENGGHLYFVSESQFEFYQNMFIRLDDYDLVAPDGYINSGYCESTAPINLDKEYDTVTVGRSEMLKDPFWLHKITKGNSGMNSLVLTDNANFDSENQNAYVEKHMHLWEDPQCTIRGLLHDKVLSTMAKGKVYVSTCPVESWGITCLEALSAGLPVLLATDKSGKHASECIPADQSHYEKMRKSSDPGEVREKIRGLMNISDDKRQEISGMTREKHSRENWVKAMEKIIDRRLSDKQETTYARLPI